MTDIICGRKRETIIMSSTSKETKISIPPSVSKKGKKRKLPPSQIFNAESALPEFGKSSGVKRTKKSKPKKEIVKVDLFEPNDNYESTSKDNKKNKKRKSDEQHLPRSSFRLYLRRQNKVQEQKKRTEKYIRTVELIKRPIELRDPATKILFMASLNLYPKSDAGGGPIVIIKQSSNYDHMVHNLSESSESSEQDIPIIEVVSDQDEATTNSSISNNSGDSFFLPEICLEVEPKEIISSTPIPRSRKKGGSKLKDNVARTRAISVANRKPLTQRQHNSISAAKPAPSNSVAKTTKKIEEIKSFKHEIAQAQSDFNPCVQSKVPEIKPVNDVADKFRDLDSIKRMLAKLHTYIAPVEEEIQLITIE